MQLASVSKLLTCSEDGSERVEIPVVIGPDRSRGVVSNRRLLCAAAG